MRTREVINTLTLSFINVVPNIIIFIDFIENIQNHEKTKPCNRDFCY